MTRRNVLVTEIGGVMIALGIIWFGLSGFNSRWDGISDLLPVWMVQPASAALLALAGALLIGFGRWRACDSESFAEIPSAGLAVSEGQNKTAAIRIDRSATSPLPPRVQPRLLSPGETAVPMVRRAAGDSRFVWLSDLDVIGHVRAYKSGDPVGSRASLYACAALNFQGDVVPPIVIPKTVRPLDPLTGEIDDTSHEYEEMAVLKEVNLLRDRFLLVGPKVAGVLSQFDLGAGGLHPVTVLDRQGGVAAANTYYFWNFGNKRACFLPEESTGLRKSAREREQGENTVYFMPVIPAEDSIVLSSDCLTGPDVWRERHLERGTFLSDRLVQALRQAKLDTWFELVRCRVL